MHRERSVARVGQREQIGVHDPYARLFGTRWRYVPHPLRSEQIGSQALPVRAVVPRDVDVDRRDEGASDPLDRDVRAELERLAAVRASQLDGSPHSPALADHGDELVEIRLDDDRTRLPEESVEGIGLDRPEAS